MNAHTQTSRAERRARAPRGRSRFVLITGGKGGVGKSTLAANLGVSLARGSRAAANERGDPTAPDHHPLDCAQGATVSRAARIPRGPLPPLLVDLDLGLANLDVMLRLDLDPTRNLEGFLRGQGDIEDCVVRGPEGLGVLPARSGALELARPDDARRDRLIEGIETVSASFGIVLGDSPGGIGPDVMHFAARADRVLLVTTPDPAALTDAYGLVKALDTFAAAKGLEVPTPELFVNMAVDSAQARSISDRLGTVCQRFLSRVPRLVGWMPRSRIVMRSIAEQQPFVSSEPQSLPSRCVTRLARRFSGMVRTPSPGLAP